MISKNLTIHQAAKETRSLRHGFTLNENYTETIFKAFSYRFTAIFLHIILSQLKKILHSYIQT